MNTEETQHEATADNQLESTTGQEVNSEGNNENVTDVDNDGYYKPQDFDYDEDEFEYEELNEEVAFKFLKETKGIEVDSLDDFLKPKEVNPYEDVLDEDDRAYLNFKKETGRSRKEFEALNSNLDEIPKIELARERVRKETGLKLTDEQVDEYISEELGIDLEEPTARDQIKLANYTKDILNEKKSEQEKYRKPIENIQEPKKENSNSTKEEFVTLENGAVMPKSKYDDIIKNREQEILKAKESVNRVTNSVFKITVDDKGIEKELNYEYSYSEEDKHSMVSIVSDVDGVIKRRYESENGFDYKSFSEDLQWSDPKFREKAIGSLLHKAIAETTENLLKERGNVNFTQEPLQKQNLEGVKIVSMRDAIFGNH
jgi:hypothetical protein